MNLIHEATTLQFVLGLVVLITGLMIFLQAVVNRAVWGGYLVLFFGSLVGLAVTLR